ncbi:MAG TPA: PAS domain S-box protein, partial [Thermodesulfobacteriota bacterium]|nr:PAS domain S-box protein [Thermodesulfobacteriota bacterium]
YDVEHRLVVDGQEKWVREKAYLEFDQAGELLGGFGITQDITERKLAENALRESEERFRLLVENAPEAIYIQAQGQFVYVKKVAVRLFGATSPDQLLGQPILCRIHPDYQEIVRERIRLINEERREVPMIEQRCLKLDGTSFYAEVSAVPFLYEGRNGALVFCRDITERKRAEEMLWKIKDLLNATGRMAKVGGWEFDIKTMELVWTEEVYLIHEVDMPYEPTVSKALDFYGPQSRPIIEQAVQRAIEHGEPFNLELEIITAKNNHKWVHAIGKADQEHFKVFGTFQDISERKQLEEALQRSHAELEEQVRERTAELVRTNEEVRRISGKLLSAHEEERKRIAGEIHDILGSGLSAIKFKIEDVMQKIGNSSKVVSEYLNPVVPLIQETIAECRRIQMNLRPPMLDELGLLPTLSWFFRRFQTIYSNISVEQAMDIEEEDVPGPLKIVIFRVIQEAVNNAAKYSQADLVGQSLRKQDGQMELVIRDNGRGFDLEEPFSPERARKGLGLTSMKERVELSGGFFSIESAKGEGTVIRAVWSI